MRTASAINDKTFHIHAFNIKDEEEVMNIETSLSSDCGAARKQWQPAGEPFVARFEDNTWDAQLVIFINMGIEGVRLTRVGNFDTKNRIRTKEERFLFDKKEYEPIVARYADCANYFDFWENPKSRGFDGNVGEMYEAEYLVQAMSHPAFHATMNLLQVNERRVELQRRCNSGIKYNEEKILLEEIDALDCRLVSSVPASPNDLQGVIGYLKYLILCDINLFDDLSLKDMERLKVVNNILLYLGSLLAIGDDPVVELLKEWESVCTQIDSTDDEKEHEKREALWEQRFSIEDNMLAIPATTPDGALAQVKIAAQRWGVDELELKEDKYLQILQRSLQNLRSAI